MPSVVMLVAESEASVAFCNICVICGHLCADKQNNYIESIVCCMNGVVTQILEITDASLFFVLLHSFEAWNGGGRITERRVTQFGKLYLGLSRQDGGKQDKSEEVKWIKESVCACVCLCTRARTACVCVFVSFISRQWTLRSHTPSQTQSSPNTQLLLRNT